MASSGTVAHAFQHMRTLADQYMHTFECADEVTLTASLCKFADAVATSILATGALDKVLRPGSCAGCSNVV